MSFQRRFVDIDAEPRAVRHVDVAVAHDEIAFGADRILGRRIEAEHELGRAHPHARLRLLDARKHCPSLGRSRGGDAPEFGGYILLATQIAKTLQHDFRALLGVDNQR